MTPQERQLVDELFIRLSQLEQSPREPDAVAAINDGLRRAPNAIYALVQTVLLQEEALKQAHARLQQFENATQEPQQPRGFLDSMRGSLFGGGAPQRGSVPSVGGSPWNTPQQGQPQGQPMAQQQGGGFGGGSFLGTAAAAAAGAIGGGLLMNSLQGIMGGGREKQAFGSPEGGRDSGRGGDASKSDLARDAGTGDIGKNSDKGNDKDNDRQGLFDTAANDQDDDDDDFDGDDEFGDSGGDSDVA